ncbi:MAG: hypothetical protein AB7O78_06220 [Thermoleophilia bacterium]
MIGISEDRRAFVDARGRVYPFREVGAKMLDTLVKTLVVVGILYLIAGLWVVFH